MEYWVDVVMSDKMEEWLLLQGATVHPSNRLPAYLPNGKQAIEEPTVFFGGRQIHFYSGSRRARIFFNTENENTRSLFLLMFSDAIECHNFKDMKQLF